MVATNFYPSSWYGELLILILKNIYGVQLFLLHLSKDANRTVLQGTVKDYLNVISEAIQPIFTYI